MQLKVFSYLWLDIKMMMRRYETHVHCDLDAQISDKLDFYRTCYGNTRILLHYMELNGHSKTVLLRNIPIKEA